MADLQCGRFGLGQLLSRRLKGALLLQNLGLANVEEQLVKGVRAAIGALGEGAQALGRTGTCLLYTSPSPRD